MANTCTLIYTFLKRTSRSTLSHYTLDLHVNTEMAFTHGCFSSFLSGLRSQAHPTLTPFTRKLLIPKIGLNNNDQIINFRANADEHEDLYPHI